MIKERIARISVTHFLVLILLSGCLGQPTSSSRNNSADPANIIGENGVGYGGENGVGYAGVIPPLSVENALISCATEKSTLINHSVKCIAQVRTENGPQDALALSSDTSLIWQKPFILKMKDSLEVSCFESANHLSQTCQISSPLTAEETVVELGYKISAPLQEVTVSQQITIQAKRFLDNLTNVISKFSGERSDSPFFTPNLVFFETSEGNRNEEMGRLDLRRIHTGFRRFSTQVLKQKLEQFLFEDLSNPNSPIFRKGSPLFSSHSPLFNPTHPDFVPLNESNKTISRILDINHSGAIEKDDIEILVDFLEGTFSKADQEYEFKLFFYHFFSWMVQSPAQQHDIDLNNDNKVDIYDKRVIREHIDLATDVIKPKERVPSFDSLYGNQKLEALLNSFIGTTLHSFPYPINMSNPLTGNNEPVFTRFDIDGNGKITAEEISQAVRYLRKK